MRPQISQTIGNLGFIHVRSPHVDDIQQQGGGAGFFCRFVGAARRKIDLHIQDRQIMIFDKVHAGPGRRLPVFNLDARLYQRTAQENHQ